MMETTQLWVVPFKVDVELTQESEDEIFKVKICDESDVSFMVRIGLFSLSSLKIIFILYILYAGTRLRRNERR